MDTISLHFEESLQGDDNQSIVNAIDTHPWVKKNVVGPMTIYTLNLKAFNKWLKTDEGRNYGKRGCGDDAIYTASAFLRMHMPRGMAVYDDGTDFFVIRGFLKFTGISSGDEDEESTVTDNTNAFMYSGKTLTDCSRFISTEKSNGENGKWAIRRCKDGSYIIFAGSKNAMKYWKLGDNPTTEFNSDGYLPCESIAQWVYDYCENMTDDIRNEFIKVVADNEWTLMFEINHPDSEHVFPIDEMRMDFVSILDSMAHPIDCQTAFNFFSKYGLTHVSYSVHDYTNECFNELIESTRSRTDTEGIVIYLYDDTITCIGLIKIKTDYYVIARAIRECFKHFIHPALAGNLIDGPVTYKPKGNKNMTEDEAFTDVEKRIKKRMPNMRHLNNCDERCQDWTTTGLSFIAYWYDNYCSKTTYDETIEYLHYSQNNYGTLFDESIRDTISSELINEMILELESF
jgi:hypothetical protein